MFLVELSESRRYLARRNLSPLPLPQQLVTNLPGLMLRERVIMPNAQEGRRLHGAVAVVHFFFGGFALSRVAGRFALLYRVLLRKQGVVSRPPRAFTYKEALALSSVCSARAAEPGLSSVRFYNKIDVDASNGNMSPPRSRQLWCGAAKYARELQTIAA